MTKTPVPHNNFDGYVYLMSGTKYTREGLVEALDAEAATLPPETWRCGWNVNDYIIEAEQVGVINRIHPEDDYDDPWWQNGGSAHTA